MNSKRTWLAGVTFPCCLLLVAVIGCNLSGPAAERPVAPKTNLVSGMKPVPLTPSQYRLARTALDSLDSIRNQYIDPEGKITFESMQMSTTTATKDVDAATSVLSDCDLKSMFKAGGAGYLHALMLWATVINYKGSNGAFNHAEQQKELAEVDSIFQTKGLPPKKKLEQVLSISGTAVNKAKEILDQAGQ